MFDFTPDFSGLLGDSGPPAGSLSPALGTMFNPEQLRRRQRSQAMMAMGANLLANSGPQAYGNSFLGNLGSAIKEGADAANKAEDRFYERGFNNLKLQDYDYDRKKKLDEDAKKAQHESAMWDVLKSAPPELQSYAKADPEGALKIYSKRFDPKDPVQEMQAKKLDLEIEQMRKPKPDYKTIAPGNTLVDPSTGRVVYQAQPEAEKPTSSMQEYRYAQQQGYTGSFQQYQTEQKRAGASNVNVNGDQKLTEAQSKDLGFYARGRSAAQELDALDSNLADWRQRGLSGIPGAGNYFNTEQYQRADRAGREFLAIVLRKDSGAAITQDEMDQYGRIYLPKPGDKPENLAAKKQARETVLNSIRLGGGTARPLYDQIDTDLDRQQQLTPSVNAAPPEPVGNRQPTAPSSQYRTRGGVNYEVVP